MLSLQSEKLNELILMCSREFLNSFGDKIWARLSVVKGEKTSFNLLDGTSWSPSRRGRAGLWWWSAGGRNEPSYILGNQKILWGNPIQCKISWITSASDDIWNFATNTQLGICSTYNVYPHISQSHSPYTFVDTTSCRKEQNTELNFAKMLKSDVVLDQICCHSPEVSERPVLLTRLSLDYSHPHIRTQ